MPAKWFYAEVIGSPGFCIADGDGYFEAFNSETMQLHCSIYKDFWIASLLADWEYLDELMKGGLFKRFHLIDAPEPDLDQEQPQH